MDINPYTDDQAQASEYLRLALALLSGQRIAPSPLNYRIGYDIVSGRNEALRVALDELTGAPGGFAGEDLWTLYKQTFIQDDKALEAMRQELRRILNNVRDEVSQSGDALGLYGDTLTQFAELLEHQDSPSSMVREVDRVVRETRATEAKQRQLKMQLVELGEEVATLREELEQVRKESLTDGLTELANRKSFDTTLETLLREAQEQDTPVCLLMADIDNFKQVNDDHGHLVGDKILRFVASTLKRCVKGKDLVARYGGEEFAVILPQTDLDGAVTVAEQIRQTVSAGYLKDKANQTSYGRITVSIGVAGLLVNDQATTLVQRADRALYMAKDRGRNRVEHVI